MTEAHPQKKARWSRGSIRLLAWVSGSAAFMAVAGLVGMAPKQAAAAHDATAGTKKAPVQKVVVRRIIRRVVIVDAPTPTYSYSSGSSYSGSTSSSSSSGGITVAAPAPAPPPPVSTGGSAPPP